MTREAVLYHLNPEDAAGSHVFWLSRVAYGLWRRRSAHVARTAGATRRPNTARNPK